ncbi:MAG TPA: hypothetical protein VGM03_03880 [Phycisphaerae bacterium]|jgi:hypothetical protein
MGDVIVARRDILAHFGVRSPADPDESAQRAGEVLSAVLYDQEMPSVDALVKFCADPGNLETFVPDADARSAMSNELTEGLVEFKRRGYGLPAEVFVG